MKEDEELARKLQAGQHQINLEIDKQVNEYVGTITDEEYEMYQLQKKGSWQNQVLFLPDESYKFP